MMSQPPVHSGTTTPLVKVRSNLTDLKDDILRFPATEDQPRKNEVIFWLIHNLHTSLPRRTPTGKRSSPPHSPPSPRTHKSPTSAKKTPPVTTTTSQCGFPTLPWPQCQHSPTSCTNSPGTKPSPLSSGHSSSYLIHLAYHSRGPTLTPPPNFP